jgi:hypothetical protein
MATTPASVKKELQSLRAARKALGKFASAKYLRSLQTALNVLDREMAAVQRALANGTIGKAAAKRQIAQARKMRRGGQRLLATVAVTKQQALRSIEQKISALEEQ